MGKFADSFTSPTGDIIIWVIFGLVLISFWILEKKTSDTEKSKKRFQSAVALALPLVTFLHGYWYFNWRNYGPVGEVIKIHVEYPGEKILTFGLLILGLGFIYMSFKVKRYIIGSIVVTSIGLLLLGSFLFRPIPDLEWVWAQMLGCVGFFVAFLRSLAILLHKKETIVEEPDNWKL